MSLATLGNNNVNSVIANLLKMSPAQRQTFAQNHAEDPLMLSAAKFVDNKIKEQAQAYLAQQSGAAPPKVNAQVIQAMGPQVPQGQPQGQPQPQQPQPQQAAQALPEDSGIAQLPARNMQGMAGGGIVAFAGEDESLVQEPEYTYVRNAFGQFVKVPVDKTEKKPGIYEYLKNKNSVTQEQLQKDFETQRMEELAKRQAAKQVLPSATQVPVGAKVPVAAPVGPSMNPGTKTYVAPPTAPEQDAVAKAPAGSAQPAMPTMKTTSDSDILATYKRINEQLNPNVTVDPYAAQTEANRADAASIGQRQLSDATAREQGLAALLSKREGRIQEREGRIQSTEDLSTKMAIINAGLAMMQSTGKGLAGIAEGATVGTKQYAEGMKASELARQKIEDAKDAFDELRFNQEGMTAKEKTAAVATITNASIAARNAGVQNMKDKQGLTAKEATNLFDNTIKAQMEAQRAKNQLLLEGVQQAGANTRSDKQIASQITKFNPMTSYADYLKGFAGKDETIATPKSYADYVAQFQGPKLVDVPDEKLKP